MTLERQALEFLLCLVPKHRLLSDDPAPVLRAALDRLEVTETRIAALEKALRLAESLLRHLFTTGQKPVKWALHPDSPPPQEVINAVCAALARKEEP